MKAEFVRDVDGFTGEAKLYRLSSPIKYEGGETEYVVASATSFLDHRPETYIFPADENGAVLDWGELPGSYQGGFDHQRAIDGLIGAQNG